MIIFYFILIIPSYGAAEGSSGDQASNNDYELGESFVKRAKKLEKKGKIKKANKRYERALRYLIKSNKEKPTQPDTLNYLGFATRKLGDFNQGEKYYLEGLAIAPKHIGINEYLGELYVATNRMDLAKERLEILKTCNCEEYQDLKQIIDGTRKSKY